MVVRRRRGRPSVTGLPPGQRARAGGVQGDTCVTVPTAPHADSAPSQRSPSGTDVRHAYQPDSFTAKLKVLKTPLPGRRWVTIWCDPVQVAWARLPNGP